MTYDQLRELINNRRSIRYFSDKPLESDTIMKLLEVATLAPSVENIQPWKFHVIRNEDLKKKMMEQSCYGNFVAGASTFIVTVCDRSAQRHAPDTIWNPRELEYSCVTAVHAMMLAAASMDVGSCWVSLHHGPIHNLLKLPDHHVVVGGLMLGHLKAGEEQANTAHERHALSESVVYHD